MAGAGYPAEIKTHLRGPLLGNVLERVRAVDSEAHQDDISVGVREGTQSVVVLLEKRARLESYYMNSNPQKSLKEKNSLVQRSLVRIM